MKDEITSVDESLSKEPRNVGFLLQHAELLLVHLASWLGISYFANQALQDNNSAIELDPSSPLSWLERGMTYYTLDMQDLAVKDFSTSIDIQPNDRAYYNRGVSLWRKLESPGKARQGSVAKDVVQVLDALPKGNRPKSRE